MSEAHLWLILLMVLAGLIGGFANHLTTADASHEKSSLGANLLVSIVAAFVTPLFLSLAKSALLDQLISKQDSGNSVGADIFVFFGFCLVAAFSARVFVRNLTDAVLNLAHGQERLKNEVKDLKVDMKEVGPGGEPEVTPEESIDTIPDADHRQRAAATKLGPNERHLLEALVSREFTWRSVAGVRAEVGLSRDTATSGLEALVKAELADKKLSKTGGWLYRITAGGRLALGLQPLAIRQPRVQSKEQESVQPDSDLGR